jgi:hypothetical protein
MKTPVQNKKDRDSIGSLSSQSISAHRATFHNNPNTSLPHHGQSATEITPVRAEEEGVASTKKK